MNPTPDARERIRAYHERTKHHTQRFALGPGALDWANQPDPFRTWAGAPRTELPLTGAEVSAGFADLERRPDDPGAPPTRAVDVASLGALLELALGLTAWKELGEARWALRSNPSSGNLHPTEGYVVTAALPGVRAGVHHYAPLDHALELRCELDPALSARLAAALPAGSFLVGLSSIHWREAWKYGERAFRYCQHDVGHALASVRYAAAALGWTARRLDEPGDADVSAALGLDREADHAGLHALDREHPDALVLVAPQGSADLAVDLDELLRVVRAGVWRGEPNALSPEHVSWPIVEEAARATEKPRSRSRPHRPPAPSWTPTPRDGPAARAAEILRQRRSAVALDGRTPLSRSAFFAMLERLLPRPDRAPWDLLPEPPRVHLGLFVHRVEGLEPGVYLLERTEAVHEALRPMLGEAASWARPAGCPGHLRLFLIGAVDARRTAASISCGQDIAADGAFAVAFFADLAGALEEGAHAYRHLHWEAGVLGHVLYLEAEAAGVRGTGIGCFFDDASHRVLGLEGGRFQVLYHFTLGTAVEDERLDTLPPYAHLSRG